MSINILYCGDAHMRDGLLISTLSLLKHADDELHIFVFTARLSNSEKQFEPLTAQDVEPLDALVKKNRPGNFVRLIDLTDRFMAEEPVINMETRFTPYCMLRLWADELDEIPDRLLYLDTDIVCRRPFDDFYKQNMDGVELAGVLDYYGSWFFKQHKTEFGREYLNSGMLLLNMGQIRRTGLFARARQMCRDKRMFLPDQSALNHLVASKRIVARKYNEQHAVEDDTVFQHFTTSFRFFPWVHTVTIKPWQIDQVHSVLGLHEYDDILADYQRLRTQMWPDQDAAQEEGTGVQPRVIASHPVSPDELMPAAIEPVDEDAGEGDEEAARRFASAFGLESDSSDNPFVDPSDNPSDNPSDFTSIAAASHAAERYVMDPSRSIPVFFVSDEPYVPYLSVALTSLVAHTTDSRHYLIHILSKGITKQSQERLSTIASGHPNVDIVFVEMGDKILDTLKSDPNKLRADYVTLTIYFRLFIAEMFPQFDRAVYVDADTCFLADIADLYDTDLKGNAMGAINDGFVAGDPTMRAYCVRMLGVDPTRYVNSGVLLMDLDQLRQLHFASAFVELMNRYHVRSIAADQDYINVMLADRLLLLDGRWDVMTGAGKKVDGAKLIHYNLFGKPWHYPDFLYGDEFWKYAASSPFLPELEHERDTFDPADAESDDEKKARLVADAKDFSQLPVTFRSLKEEGVQVSL